MGKLRQISDFDWFSAPGACSAVTSASTSEPFTAASIQKIMDDVDRKWPKSERGVAIELPPSTEDELLARCERSIPDRPDGLNIQSLAGMPLERNFAIPPMAFVIRMADGSRVIHYPSGLAVRCVPDPDDVGRYGPFVVVFPFGGLPMGDLLSQFRFRPQTASPERD